jgi:hypothetical protein
MTAPAVSSRLARIRNQLYNALAMDSGDQSALTETLLRQRTVAYQNQVSKQIRLVGCRREAAAPSGQQLADLRADSERDAASIVRTFNSDLERNLGRILDNNPDGRRPDIEAAISQYLAERSAWKDRQIAMMTSKTARAYADTQFREQNGIDNQQYYYFGPPPVSDECKSNMAAGIVDVQYVQKHPTPAHINCPHTWQVVATPQVKDCGALWVG